MCHCGQPGGVECVQLACASDLWTFASCRGFRDAFVYALMTTGWDVRTCQALTTVLCLQQHGWCHKSSMCRKVAGLPRCRGLDSLRVQWAAGSAATAIEGETAKVQQCVRHHKTPRHMHVFSFRLPPFLKDDMFAVVLEVVVMLWSQNHQLLLKGLQARCAAYEGAARVDLGGMFAPCSCCHSTSAGKTQLADGRGMPQPAACRHAERHNLGLPTSVAPQLD